MRTTINAQGQIIDQICRGFGISPTTYYRWRKEYGGLKVIQAKRLKELEKENARLRKVVSDLSLNDGSCVRLRPSHRNQAWSYDFVMDRTHNGRAIKILTVIDECPRGCAKQ